MTVTVDRWNEEQMVRVSFELIERINQLHMDAGHNTNLAKRQVFCSCGLKAVSSLIYDPLFGHILTLRVGQVNQMPLTIQDTETIKSILNGTHKIYGIKGYDECDLECVCGKCLHYEAKICEKCGQTI